MSTVRKRSKQKTLVERKETEKNKGSQNIISLSMSKNFVEKVLSPFKNNGILDIKNKSDFFRKCSERFIYYMEVILSTYPELTVKEPNETFVMIPHTYNYQADRINKLNGIIKSCSLFYNRSEGVRFGILLYLLENVGMRWETNPSPPSGYVKKSELTGVIRYVKYKGKICPILDLDYGTEDDTLLIEE